MGVVRSSNFVSDHSIENVLHPAYMNDVINNLSGKTFKIQSNKEIEFQRKFIDLIEDVPDFIRLVPNALGKKFVRVPQYKGYLVNLCKYKNIDEFLAEIFSKNSRKNVRAKIRKLENEHKIKYAFHFGSIDKFHYDRLFEDCHRLMLVRFDQKKIYNRYLLDWGYYYQLFYPMILNGSASAFVIYDDDKPITITLNFHREDIVYSFIQIYDVDYSIFSMGDVAMYKNLEWCLANHISIWDTSKGATDNKKRWCNHVYQFEHHLFYEPSLLTSLKVRYLTRRLALKQWLREKGIIGGRFQLDTFYYYTRRRRLKGFDWREG